MELQLSTLLAIPAIFAENVSIEVQSVEKNDYMNIQTRITNVCEELN